MGNVVSAGLGQAPARQAAIHAGLPPAVGALTINKVCGSGLKAVMLAAQGIATGDADVVVAGGMESMSNCPYLLAGAREGLRLGHGELRDSMIWDGLWDAYADYHMGCTGEIVAEKYGVTRERAGPVRARQPPQGDRRHQGRQVQGRDPARADPAEEGRAGAVRARRVAARGHVAGGARRSSSPRSRTGGTVTAGNAPGVNDGAAALVVTSAERAKALGRKPLARIVGQAVAGPRARAGDDDAGARRAEALGEDRLERRRASTCSRSTRRSRCRRWRSRASWSSTPRRST